MPTTWRKHSRYCDPVCTGMAAVERSVYRSGDYVHARFTDFRAPDATARRRHPPRPGAVHPSASRRCPWSSPSSFQPGWVVGRSLRRRRSPGLPRRRRLCFRPGGCRATGSLPVGAGRRPGSVSALLFRRRLRYVNVPSGNGQRIFEGIFRVAQRASLSILPNVQCSNWSRKARFCWQKSSILTAQIRFS